MIKYLSMLFQFVNFSILVGKILDWLTPEKKEIPMGINKKEMVEVLKDLAEWNDFLTVVEKSIIEVLTDDKKQVWYLEVTDIVLKLVGNAITPLSIAIEDSGKIPEQWAAASTAEKIMFFVNLVMAHAVAIVEAIFNKPTVETPAV